MANIPVPKLQSATQEIKGLCALSQEFWKTETKKLLATIDLKLQLLPQIRAHHGISDHEYLKILRKLRDDLEPHAKALAVTTMIANEMAAISQKTTTLQAFLHLPDSRKAFPISSISTKDASLDVDSNTDPLFLNFDPKKRQYRIVDEKGATRKYWSHLKFTVNRNSQVYESIQNVVYAGKRIIIAPENKPGIFLNAFFIEMSSPKVADAFLRHLSENSEVTIWPKAFEQLEAWWATYGPG